MLGGHREAHLQKKAWRHNLGPRVTAYATTTTDETTTHQATTKTINGEVRTGHPTTKGMLDNITVIKVLTQPSGA